MGGRGGQTATAWNDFFAVDQGDYCAAAFWDFGGGDCRARGFEESGAAGAEVPGVLRGGFDGGAADWVGGDQVEWGGLWRDSATCRGRGNDQHRAAHGGANHHRH